MCEGFEVLAERSKPWGTGQTFFAAKDLINESFTVINAEDYYGKGTFIKVHDSLVEEYKDNAISMAEFILKNTLLDNGGVTRGVCEVSDVYQ